MAREMVMEQHEKTDKWFQTVGTEPSWLKGLNLKHSNTKYIKIPSLKSWYEFMNNSDDLVEKDIYLASKKQDSWSGTDTWEEYLEILDNGDEKVMKQIKEQTQKNVSEFEHRYEKEIAGYKFDVSGQFFDIGLVLSGIPEVWLEPEYKEEKIPQITIKLDMGFTAEVNSQTVIKNGARVLGMAKVLETMGVEVRIELYCFQGGWIHRNGGYNLVTSLVAKDYNEPINYRKLSGLLTTAHFRRGIFRIMETIAGRNISSGYGNQPKVDGFVRMREDREILALETQIFKGFKNVKV